MKLCAFADRARIFSAVVLNWPAVCKSVLSKLTCGERLPAIFVTLNEKHTEMKKLSALGLVAMLAISGMNVFAADSKTASKEKGAKPAASPGWIVVEEDVWTPLRFEPLYALDSIRYHFRRNEEMAAANQIDKAVSWLKLAASHALPITQEKLTASAKELTTVAKDLRAGKITAAAAMDGSLARAASALSEWHFYKSKEAWAKDEGQDAGRDLAMAAQYLQHAANSAHYQFGPDTTEVVTKLYEHGKLKSESTHYDHDALGRDLQSIETAINDLSVALKS